MMKYKIMCKVSGPTICNTLYELSWVGFPEHAITPGRHIDPLPSRFHLPPGVLVPGYVPLQSVRRQERDVCLIYTVNNHV